MLHKKRVGVEQQQPQSNDEVPDRSLLVGLALLAKADGYSVAEELNAAVSSYVMARLPQTLNENGTAPVHALSHTEN